MDNSFNQECDMSSPISWDFLFEMPEIESCPIQTEQDQVIAEVQNSSTNAVANSNPDQDQNNTNSRSSVVDLRSIMENDPAIIWLFVSKWDKTAYVFEGDCQTVANSIVDAVVQSYGLKACAAMLKDLAKDLVSLYPFLGDATDADLGYKIYYDVKRTPNCCEYSGYFFDRLCHHRLQVRLREQERIDLEWNPLGKDDAPVALEDDQPGSTAKVRLEEALARRALAEPKGGISAVRKNYPEMFTTPGMIVQDFYVLYPKLRGKFTRNWPRTVQRLFEYSIEAKVIQRTGILKHYSQWNKGDKALAACILVPHILVASKPKITRSLVPIPKSKARTTKRDRAAMVVQFAKDGSSVKDVKGHHPHIFIEGSLEQLAARKISVYIHGRLVPTRSVDEAIETLFTSHFVFCLSFPAETRPFLSFLLYGVYEKGMTGMEQPTMTVRHLISQTRGPPRLDSFP